MSAEEYANWDMTPYFDAFDGDDFRAFTAEVRAGLSALQVRLEALGPIVTENLGAWAEAICAREELLTRVSHLSSYLGCLGSADTKDGEIRAARAAFYADLAEVDKLKAVLLDAFQSASEEVFSALLAHPSLEGAGHDLRRMRKQASKRMSKELELLAADLSVDGLGAWGRLYDAIDGGLDFELKVPGEETRRVPVAWKRSLTQDPDPSVRKAALEGSNEAWAGAASSLVASLNAIAGWRHTLGRWRGESHFLEPALFQGGISREVLDAMMEAVAAKRQTVWRYLKIKARLVGKEQLGFQDLACPLPMDEPKRVGWAEARETIVEAFDGFEPELGAFARMAFDKNWIDSEPRAGKRSGGFCSGSQLIGQTRIFMTFNHTMGDTQTLAHELGHAYHGWVMRDMRAMALRYPMTLAETASMFAEAVLTDAVLENPETSAADRDLILDTRLNRASTSVLNIPMRYIFEKAFYEERLKGTVSLERTKALMLDAQRQCYGDCLNEDEMDPWFWASKLHFYLTGTVFYNFPYTFGYAFSQGVFDRAKAEGPGFFETYKRLLRGTGSTDPETLAREVLGVEMSDPAFWTASMKSIDEDLARFEARFG